MKPFLRFPSLPAGHKSETDGKITTSNVRTAPLTECSAISDQEVFYFDDATVSFSKMELTTRCIELDGQTLLRTEKAARAPAYDVPPLWSSRRI